MSKERETTTKGLTNNGDQNGIKATGVDDNDKANEQTDKQEQETVPKRSNVSENNSAGADLAKTSKVDDVNKASDKEMVSYN